MPLAFGFQDSYSLKYNLLFDKLFGFSLIGKEICKAEINYYLKQNNKYGIPLDSRETYTKSDWLLWVAGLTDDKDKREQIYKPVIGFLKNSPERRPFSDWYGTIEGEIHFFINRSVQGGIFTPLLKEKNTV